MAPIRVATNTAGAPIPVPPQAFTLAVTPNGKTLYVTAGPNLLIPIRTSTNLPGTDSCERRRRKEGADWPPHLLIGRKVYYRREILSDWLRQRESATQSVQRGLDRTGDAEAVKSPLMRRRR